MPTRRAFLMRATAGTVLAAVNSQIADAGGKATAVLSRAPIKGYRIANTDLTVSRIAFGAGGLESNQSAVNLINTVYDHGITCFDVADVYREEPFGAVLKQSPGLREKIVIQSKCGLTTGERSKTDHLFHLDCSTEHIVSTTEGSLRRLRTDHLDILLLHWPDALVEPEEVAKAFDVLKHSGKVRYFGVSNHTPMQIELLKKYVEQPIVVNQIYLSLENSYLIAGGLATLWDNTRNPYNYNGASGTLDYCRLHEIQVQAWSPLRGNLIDSSESAAPEMKQAVQVLADISQKKNATPSAIALAWLLRHPARIVPIISSSNPEHVIEDCAADSVDLSRDDWYDLLTATVRIESRKPI